MATLNRIVAGILLLSATVGNAAAGDLAQVEVPEQIREEARGSYIFVFSDTVPPDEVAGRAQALARTERAELRHVFTQAIRGFSANVPPQAAARIAANEGVAYYEGNGVAYIVAPLQSSGRGGAKPGDTAEPPQETPWGVTRVGGAQSGAGKHAWIIDTGIDLDNPDLKVGSGANFARGRSADDGNGHGTHVAGTVAALNNTIDVVGVAAGATVHPVRVLDNNGFGTIDAVIAGVDYVAGAADPTRGDCANMSLGASGHFQSLHDAVSAAADKGVRFAIAAGNASTSALGSEPAHVEHANVYTVSAIDGGDVFASFSNYGNPPVDFAAPGVGILSTRRGGGITTMSGTSMAAPHVCGLLLLGDLNTNGFASGDPDNNPDLIAHH
jgi:subtilisin family serine protease